MGPTGRMLGPHAEVWPEPGPEPWGALQAGPGSLGVGWVLQMLSVAPDLEISTYQWELKTTCETRIFWRARNWAQVIHDGFTFRRFLGIGSSTAQRTHLRPTPGGLDSEESFPGSCGITRLVKNQTNPTGPMTTVPALTGP